MVQARPRAGFIGDGGVVYKMVRKGKDAVSTGAGNTIPYLHLSV